MRAFLAALLLGLSMPTFAQDDAAPEEAVSEEVADETTEETAADEVTDVPEEVADEATEEGGDEAGETEGEATEVDLPDEIPVPADEEEALEQAGSLVDAIMAKSWWGALILALGLGIFIGNKFLGAKAEEKKEDA